MPPLTEDQRKLKEAAQAATPGPWRLGTFPNECAGAGDVVVDNDVGAYTILAGNSNFPDDAKANANFVALANPSAILALLAQVEAVPAHPNWRWQKFEDWLASPITYPGSHVEYVRLAFNSGRLASPAVEQEPKP